MGLKLVLRFVVTKDTRTRYKEFMHPKGEQVLIPLSDAIRSTSRTNLEARVVPKFWNISAKPLDAVTSVLVVVQIFRILGCGIVVYKQFLGTVQVRKDL